MGSKIKTKWDRPIKEVQDALQTQVRFLRASCRSYDDGNFEEAARIASAIFIMVHDGNQASLLTQLKIRAELEFHSFARAIPPGNLLGDQPFVRTLWGKDENGTPFAINLPKFDVRGTLSLVKFHQWWEKDVVFQHPDNMSMNRRTLILSVRNQDGGGHVDRSLTDPAYVEFSRSESPWMFDPDTGEEPYPVPPRPHLPTVRHIGFELDRTLVAAGVVGS